MGRFPLVHALGAALINDALGIAHDDIVVRDADSLDQLGAGDGGGPGTVHDNAHVLGILAGQEQCVDQAGDCDDRGAMLVIMHDRNVHPLLERLFNDETFRGGNVFQIDAAKARLHQSDGIDEGFGVFRVQFEVDRIDVGEALEEDGLAFHHRLGGERAQIAHAENGGAIGDHSDKIAFGRIVIGCGGVIRDGLYRHGNTRRISKAQIALGRHWLGGDDLDFSGPPCRVIVKRFTIRKLNF